MDRPLYGRGNCNSVIFGSYDYTQACSRRLIIKYISLHRCFLIDAVEFHVIYYADHFEPARFVLELALPDPLADRIFTWPDPTRECFVDDRHQRRVRRIRRRKRSTSYYPHAHRVEVVSTNA